MFFCVCFFRVPACRMGTPRGPNKTPGTYPNPARPLEVLATRSPRGPRGHERLDRVKWAYPKAAKPLDALICSPRALRALYGPQWPFEGPCALGKGMAGLSRSVEFLWPEWGAAVAVVAASACERDHASTTYIYIS